jgi:predicted ATP-dependent Lon-type protease
LDYGKSDAQRVAETILRLLFPQSKIEKSKSKMDAVVAMVAKSKILGQDQHLDGINFFKSLIVGQKQGSFGHE